MPTHPFPKKVVSAEEAEIEMNERQKEPEEETVDDLAPRGQILWIRGLTRLQHQVRPPSNNWLFSQGYIALAPIDFFRILLLSLLLLSILLKFICLTSFANKIGTMAKSQKIIEKL